MKSVIDYIQSRNLRQVVIVTNTQAEARYIFLLLKAKCLTYGMENFYRVGFPWIEARTQSRILIVSASKNCEYEVRGVRVSHLLYTRGAREKVTSEFEEYIIPDLTVLNGTIGEFVWDQH